VSDGGETSAEIYDLVVHGDVALPGGGVLEGGWLGIRGGEITACSETPLTGAEVLDATGCLILPGFVDAHVHTRSCVDEGITATTRAAAAGGTTTIIDMPFDKPARPVNSLERFEAKVDDVGEEALIDVALYATFPPEGDLGMIAEMAVAGAVGFKVSTIEVDPLRFPRIPDGRLYEAFQEIAATGRPVAAHQENQEIVFTQADAFKARGDTAPIDHALSRPPVAEAEAAGRLLELAYWTGARLHMVHGTLPRTFDLIEWNRSKGVRATGETCLQYLLLTMDALSELGGRRSARRRMWTDSGSGCRTEQSTSLRRTTLPIRSFGRRPRTSLWRMPGCPAPRRWAHSCTARAWQPAALGWAGSWTSWLLARRRCSGSSRKDDSRRVPMRTLSSSIPTPSGPWTRAICTTR